MHHWEHTEIVEIHKRRYMLKNNALEIFLINGKTMLLAFDSTRVSEGGERVSEGGEGVSEGE